MYERAIGASHYRFTITPQTPAYPGGRLHIDRRLRTGHWQYGVHVFTVPTRRRPALVARFDRAVRCARFASPRAAR